MRFFKSSQPPIPSIGSFQPELTVVEYIATRRGDPDRGPQVRICTADATVRLLTDGELAWVQGSRGQQLGEVVIDDDIPGYSCSLRDIPGVVLSEQVRVVKPDLDSSPSPSPSKRTLA